MVAAAHTRDSLIDQVTLRDYRCFHGEHSARLSPLTFIVGENSTGKTSFLALIRALWDVAFNDQVPDFTEEPYDLGSFSEIAHRRGGSAARVEQFEAGFRVRFSDEAGPAHTSFSVTFGKRGTAPIPVVRRVSNDKGSVRAEQVNGKLQMRVQTSGESSWSSEIPVRFLQMDETQLVPMHLGWFMRHRGDDEAEGFSEDIEEFVLELFRRGRGDKSAPFASAPVRSKPRRTYDPSRPARDPEGDYVPMYLAHLARQNPRAWKALRRKLEEFGRASGLFDEIDVKSLGPHEGQPFQIEVRKRGKKLSGPWRNLVDVGYGVSQVLPLVTEMMRPDAPSIFLLQQPEAHLHPSAQAALGSLFCQVATDRQLVVETHSDFLLNRVRMDIRDQSTPLSPDDVSILYFERREIDVRIHSIRLDEEGNIINAPPSYGRFFMAEAARSGAY